MNMSRIPQLLRKFKERCISQGWETSENDGWIRTEGEYHNFLWTRAIHPSSFKNITSKRKCVIHRGLTYDVVKASYVAWLFSERPSKKLVETVLENPDFSKRTSIYNLNPVLKGKKEASNLNFTDSSVFKKFEEFLVEGLNVQLKPFFDAEVVSGERVVTKLA